MAYESLTLLYTSLALVNYILETYTYKKYKIQIIRKILQYRTEILHFKVSENANEMEKKHNDYL